MVELRTWLNRFEQKNLLYFLYGCIVVIVMMFLMVSGLEETLLRKYMPVYYSVMIGFDIILIAAAIIYIRKRREAL